MGIIVLCWMHWLETHQRIKEWSYLVCWLPVGCWLSWRQWDVLMDLITEQSICASLELCQSCALLDNGWSNFLFEITLILVAVLFLTYQVLLLNYWLNVGCEQLARFKFFFFFFPMQTVCYLRFECNRMIESAAQLRTRWENWKKWGQKFEKWIGVMLQVRKSLFIFFLTTLHRQNLSWVTWI